MDKDTIVHIGTPKKSGRYPWGSGENPRQRNQSFLDYVDDLRKKGLSEVERAQGCGMTTSELRKKSSLAKMELRKDDEVTAQTLYNKGISKMEIGRQMGKNESSVRSLLDENIKARNQVTNATADMLKEAVEKRGLIDVGVGAELHLNISRTKLKTAIEKLSEEGYEARNIQINQLGTGGNKKTTILVLSPPGTPYADLYKNQADIKMVIDKHTEDGGRGFLGLEFPASVSLDRVGVKFAEDGGSAKDGVIELRRGLQELSLGESSYAQVRISVGGTHYLKGMAMYSDDLPKGTDILFNSNKSKDLGKLGSLKKLKTVSKDDPTIDPDNPFGSQIKANGQRHYIDDKGKKQLSPVNKVNEEGDWEDWTKSLSSQMLAKQSPALASKQLGLTYAIKKEEYDDIMSLTNPTVKKRLLASFADDCDSSSVHLKAAALPRQGSHVILPIVDMKENEIYAPNFRPGESVVLIRYPHGGTFEIPNLKVNNNQPTAKRLIGAAKDAIGISPKVAERLSGADFDGDSVLVIPNKNGNTIKTTAALKDLKDFNPQKMYKGYEGMPKMTSHTKQMEMGKASNLITDMTIGGASSDELCRAVKHSMVVIDAEKHDLNYKKSYIDNGIASLKKTYQTSTGGASTLLSRASSDINVGVRKEKTMYKSIKNMNPAELADYNKGKKILNMTPKEVADHESGKKVYEYTNDSYFKVLKNKDKSNKEKNVADMTPEELVRSKAGKKVYEYSTTATAKTTKSSKMAEEDDAFNLSSGTAMESVYATHANKLKALGNESRKANLSTPPLVYDPRANKIYKAEVATLNGSLNVALKNAPLERQAQILANAVVAAKKVDNPDMEPDTLKKIKGMALNEARNRIGASKTRVVISEKEWEAIQAGAITNTTLTKILTNTDLNVIKQLSMPRTKNVSNLSNAKEARVKSMLAAGNTQRDIADALGISLSSIKEVM